MNTEVIRDRDDRLISIRPILNLNNQNSLHLEKFQNETLRPILKLQNPIIIQIFKEFLTEKHPKFNVFNQTVQKNIVKESLKKEIKLKNDLVALIQGLLTFDEYKIYRLHFQVLNKRITEMLISRIESQMEELY